MASDVERIFRDEVGHVVAGLVRRFGDIDIAEEAMQEAFGTAVQKTVGPSRPRAIEYPMEQRQGELLLGGSNASKPDVGTPQKLSISAHTGRDGPQSRQNFPEFRLGDCSIPSENVQRDPRERDLGRDRGDS